LSKNKEINKYKSTTIYKKKTPTTVEINEYLEKLRKGVGL